jgi:hypothetical protein
MSDTISIFIQLIIGIAQLTFLLIGVEAFFHVQIPGWAIIPALIAYMMIPLSELMAIPFMLYGLYVVLA